MTRWIDLLEKIRIIEEKYGETLNLPIQMDMIWNDKDQHSAVKAFLETDYYRFLAEVNGLEFDGSILYGISDKTLSASEVYDIFYYNAMWHEVEENRQYFFIGENNISWFVFKPSENSFLELDRPSSDVIKVYDNLDELLSGFLQSALE